MNIKTFTDSEEANAFADTVKVKEVSYDNGTIVVIYAPFFTEKEMKADRLKIDQETAQMAVLQSNMQLEYLKATQAKGEGTDETEKGIETIGKNIAHYQCQLDVIAEQEVVV